MSDVLCLPQGSQDQSVPAAAAERKAPAPASGSRLNRRQVLQSVAALGAAAAVGGMAASPRPAEAAGLRSVATWERMFQGIWARDHAEYAPKSVSTNSQSFYNLAYSVDANAAMFQATGKTMYLDRALLYIENTIRSARVSRSFSSSRFKDGFYGWLSGGQEVVLYEIYLWRYVTRILRLMRANGGVYGNASYRARFQRILAFTETNIFDKWYARGPNWYIYREVTHITAHFGYIALNLSRLTGDSGRRSRCLAVFNNINRNLPNRPGRSLRNQLINHPTVNGGAFFDDNWGVFSRPGSDTAHANGVVSFIVESQELGAEWTRTDCNRLVATLNGAILKGGSTTATYLDGSGSGGWINDGFVKLGRFSAALQQRLESYQRAQTCQLWGNCALNARLLGA